MVPEVGAGGKPLVLLPLRKPLDPAGGHVGSERGLKNGARLLRSSHRSRPEAAHAPFPCVSPARADLAAVAAQPALAQINEADRLARCQNNREALARLQQEAQFYGQYGDWSVESIARARTVMSAMHREVASVRLTEQERRSYDTGYLMNIAIYAPAFQRVRQLAGRYGLVCGQGDYDCLIGMPNALGREIDRALAGQQPVQIATRQMQQYRTNLIALNCDSAAAAGQTIESASAGVPNFAGTWADSDNRQFVISQSGADVTMTLFIFGRQHSARGNWSGGMLNMRWSAGNPPVQQQASGTVVTRGGVAVAIDFGSGFRYVRQ